MAARRSALAGIFLLCKFLIPEADIGLGIELLVLVTLSLPATITTFIWVRKYKALLVAETCSEAEGAQ